MSFEQRFRAKMMVDEFGCHLWQRATNSRGYGVVWFDGKLRLAHRVAWYLVHGRWPVTGLVLDHICEVKRCANADHLREVSNRFNILRSPASPMNVVRASTRCRNGHEYPANVRIDKHGWRVCLVCRLRQGRGRWTA